MKSYNNLSKNNPQKEKIPAGFGPKYLDWWLGNEKPPSYKNIGDNLRAYLTIGAYIVLLRYLWFWGDDRIPAWVFQMTAIMWGVWVAWFFVLTVSQTWHIYTGFCFEFLDIFLKRYVKHRKQEREVTEKERAIIQLLFIPFACSSLVLIGTVFYIIGAILRGAKLI